MTELFPYQKAGVRAIRDAGGTALLADEVGLGKSIQTLVYAHKYLSSNPAGPVVIVCPAHLKEVWRRQALQHLGVRVEVLQHERVSAGRPGPLNPNRVYLINYEILTPDNWKPRQAPAEDSWVRWLAELRPRLLVGDEGHLLSNSQSQRTRAFRWLARRCPKCLVLSGTPLPNKPENLWSVLNILRPKKYPSKFEFCSFYSMPKRTPWGWQFKGARNLDILHKELTESGLMIRRRKADVMKDLPAVTYSVVPIECDLSEYRRAEEDVVAWLNKSDPLAAQRAKRAEELARMNHLMQLAARAKLDSVVRWIRDFHESSESKLLIGAIHYAVSGALMKALGSGAVLVDGTVSEKKKTAAFDKFNGDANCTDLVGNIHAAGTGWSCTSTSTAVFVELPWRPSEVTQFSGRIHGTGRGLPGTPAQVFFLLAAGTIEERVCEALQKKQRWASAAIDGDPGTADLDISDRISAWLKNRGK